MKPTILIVEDEKSIRDLLKINLELEGYLVDLAVDGEEAINRYNTAKYSVILLDVMMPKLDGFKVCEEIRKSDNQTPILFLTAKDQGEDRINGLKLGGDDYLAKPFNLEELLLRIKNLIKRTVADKISNNQFQYQFGVNKINFLSYEICDKNGVKKQITDREINLLKLLIDNEGEVVSRNDILDKVWGYEKFPTTRTIDNYILAFRKYFEQDPRNPKYIHSVRGVGYKFTAEK